jgi:hypothetical protein
LQASRMTSIPNSLTPVRAALPCGNCYRSSVDLGP